MSRLVLAVLAAVFLQCVRAQNCTQLYTEPLGAGLTLTVAVDYNLTACFNCTSPSYAVNNDIISANTNNIFLLPDGRLLIVSPEMEFRSEASPSVNCESTGNVFMIQELVFNEFVITPSGDPINIVEGTTTDVTCDIVGNTRFNAMLFDPSGTLLAQRLNNANGVTYTLNNPQRSASGVYRCEANIAAANAGGLLRMMETNITINIQYPPENVMLDTTEIIKNTGMSLELTCSFISNPTPNVTWLVNGTAVDIAGNGMISSTVMGSTATLSFQSLVGNNTGMYSCSLNNSIGVNESAAVSVVVRVPPDPVTGIMMGDVTSSNITLSWTLGFDGRESIDNIRIMYTATGNNATPHDSQKTLPTMTMATLTDLQPLTDYTINVYAINSVGKSPPTQIIVRTLAVVPGPPTAVLVTADSSTQLTVRWTAPTVDTFTQTPIEHYQLQLSSSRDFTNVPIQTIAVPTRTYTEGSLQKGTAYYARVRVNNSIGFGQYSNVGMGSTAVDPPSMVEGEMAASFPTSLCISWDPPTDNGGRPLSNYSVQYVLVDSNSTTMATPTTITVTDNLSLIEGLSMDADYSISIAAFNTEQGPGDSVDIMASTGMEIPEDTSIDLSTSQVTAIGALVRWGVPSGISAQQFRLQYRQSQDGWSEATSVSVGRDSTQMLANLTSETEYFVRILVINNCDQFVSQTGTFETRKLIVNITVPDQVVAGPGEFVLNCRLDTGENAPDIMWSRDNGPIPADAIRNGSRLIIVDPAVEDTGNYTCTSRELASYTAPLVIVPPEPVLPLWVIIVIAVVAVVCVLAFIIVLTVVICCCCKDRVSTSKGANYKLQSKASGAWIDEGGSGFMPSTMQASASYKPADDIDAPVVRGRTQTQDQYTSATFARAGDEKGHKGMAQSDV